MEAFRQAVWDEKEELVALCLEHGADANEVFLDAVQLGYTSIVALLLSNIVTNKNKNETLKTQEKEMWRLVASFNRASLVPVLVQHGMAVDGDALETAVRLGHLEVVEALFLYNTKTKTTTTTTKGLLHVATMTGLTAMVALLLRHGVDINEKDLVDGSTALHESVRRGYLDIARLLLQHGAAVNKKNDAGMTPLLLATLGSRERIADLLVCVHKADVWIADQCGMRAIDYLSCQNPNVALRMVMAMFAAAPNVFVETVIKEIPLRFRLDPLIEEELTSRRREQQRQDEQKETEKKEGKEEEDEEFMTHFQDECARTHHVNLLLEFDVEIPCPLLV